MFQVESADDHVTLLRMDDGKVNVIGPEFVDRFEKAWQEATRNDAGVVVTGNAKAFSAGLDLKRLPTLAPAEALAFARGFIRVFRRVLDHSRPVVAAVDGPALAGGAVMALSCDFRITGPRARMGLTEVPVGVPFPSPVALLARALLPPQEHAWALLHGQVREAEACVAHGWAHEHAAEGAEARAVELARALAAHPPRPFAAAKSILTRDLVASMDRFVEEEAEAWVGRTFNAETMAAIEKAFGKR